MKRVWIGAGLLAALLAAGFLAAFALEGLAAGGTRLDRAGELALAGRWEEAEELIDDVEDEWEDRRWLLVALADHEVIEDMDAALAQLDALVDHRDAAACHALCSALGKKMEAIGKANSLTLENLF